MDLTDYGRRLYERIQEAFDYDYEIVGVGEHWQPEAGMCHDNAATLSELDPTYRAVRGWLVCDYGANIGFISHSIVQDNDGRYIDLTPPKTILPWKYPFLTDGGEHYWEVSDYLARQPKQILNYPAEGRSRRAYPLNAHTHNM